jgi:fumarylacetoacetase
VPEQDRQGFGRHNLPYGVAEDGHVVVAYGDHAIDLVALGGFDVGGDVFSAGALNPFMALGPDAWSRTRSQLSGRLDDLPESALRPRKGLRLLLPIEVADYVDFYASLEHASAMGRLLRPGSDPLPAAWRHLPIGYHGRSATVVVSGSDIRRPSGMVRGDDGPRFAPTARLDVEVELAFVVGVGSRRGSRISPERVADHVFGVVVLNDWSARDIQSFEYQPLGPFLGKSFATSISPWVVPLEALAPYQVDGPRQEPPAAPHLSVAEPRNFDISFSLALNRTVVSSMSSRDLYWSMAQQLAHLTSNGAAIKTGELFASGTISGRGENSAGSLMELTSNGAEAIKLEDGSTRTWLEDGDEAVVRGWCASPTGAEGLIVGEVRGKVVDWDEEGAS